MQNKKKEKYMEKVSDSESSSEADLVLESIGDDRLILEKMYC